MKLIVGLGNPGEKYKNNRHNVGFMVIDALASKIQSSKVKSQNYNPKFKINKKLNSGILEVNDLVLAKLTTFMNNSGIAVKKLIENFKLKIENLYVVHDDLDIALGDYKIQYAKGPKIHRGITDIEQNLSSKNFWRIRVGVDNRKPEPSAAYLSPSGTIRKRLKERLLEGREYVLQDFTNEEMKILYGVIKEVVKDLMDKIIRP